MLHGLAVGVDLDLSVLVEQEDRLAVLVGDPGFGPEMLYIAVLVVANRRFAVGALAVEGRLGGEEVLVLDALALVQVTDRRRLAAGDSLHQLLSRLGAVRDPTLPGGGVQGAPRNAPHASGSGRNSSRSCRLVSRSSSSGSAEVFISRRVLSTAASTSCSNGRSPKRRL